jgi:hypothetical protein
MRMDVDCLQSSDNGNDNVGSRPIAPWLDFGKTCDGI